MYKKLWQNKKIRISIGVTIGAALGLLYYATIGCTQGSCPLLSSHFSATLAGAVLGGLSVV